jgi:sterol desaturase/sphingolipid hydroxylase (fatty acid hydroxylase superfamily)
MIVYVIFGIICPILFNKLEYDIHQLSHNPRYTFIYNSHHQHHLEYPPNKLTVKSLNENENTSFPYFVIIISSYMGLYKILNIYYYMIFVTECTIYFSIANYLHNCYHLNDSRLHKYQWFKQLQKNHHIHHIKMYQNLNITLPITDIINNTYENNIQTNPLDHIR